MQTIVTPGTVSDTLRHLTSGLVADWFSWQDWHVVTVTSKPALHGAALEKRADIMRTLLAGHDGAVLCCLDGSCLGIFHHKYHFDLDWFRDALAQATQDPQIELSVLMQSVRSEHGEVLRQLAAHTATDNRPDSVATLDMPDFSKSVQHLDELVKLWGRIRTSTKSRAKPHVMIVDDDASTRGIISHTLKKDYALMTAETCAEAIHKHILFAPDIVFLDIGLPDRSGLELLRYIREHDPLCRVVIFSGNDYFKNRLTAFAAGAAGFVAKPFNRKVFKHYIDSWRTRPPQSAFQGR